MHPHTHPAIAAGDAVWLAALVGGAFHWLQASVTFLASALACVWWGFLIYDRLKARRAEAAAAPK